MLDDPDSDWMPPASGTVWLAGVIPVLIGGAMLVYVGFLAPKEG